MFTTFRTLPMIMQAEATLAEAASLQAAAEQQVVAMAAKARSLEARQLALEKAEGGWCLLTSTHAKSLGAHAQHGSRQELVSCCWLAGLFWCDQW